MEKKLIMVSDLAPSSTFSGLWTLGYKVIDGNKTSVKVSLDMIHAAYQDVVSATNEATVAAGSATRAAQAADSAAERANTAAGNVKDGKTTYFSIGSVIGGLAADASLTDNGTDPSGNPLKLLNLVIPKGEKGDGLDYSTMTPEEIANITGKSAYDVAVEGGFIGTVDEWLASLIGPVGPKGDGLDYSTMTPEQIASITGKSAYDVAVENGFSGNKTEWLTSLIGPIGPKGETGGPGEKGEKGETGVQGTNATTTATATQSASGLMSATDKKRSDVIWGSTTVSSLTGLPTIGRYVYCERSSSSTVSMSGSMEVGQELHIVLYNTSSGSFTQTLPNSGYYKSLSGTSIVVPGYGTLEINILCYKSGYYLIRAMAA